MKHAIRHKLASSHGASLSMALMLMLVCVTVAGVSLTAATVVAGRQAKTEDVDKSYYNVTSAAKLFWEALENKDLEVKVTRSFAKSGEVIDENSWTCTVDDHDVVNGTISSANATLFQLASYDILFDPSTSGSFATERLLTKSEVAATVDTSGAEPVLAEITASDADFTYASFDVTPGTTISNHFKTVQVDVTRKYGDTFELVFKDKDAENTYQCTLTAIVNIGGGEFTATPDNTGYTSTTTISWTPVSMSAGGVGL